MKILHPQKIQKGVTKNRLKAKESTFVVLSQVSFAIDMQDE